MTRILLVRHCEAMGNTQGVFQGQIDCDISGNAPAQLELLALRCRNMPIDVMYSSPLTRAYKTACAIDRYHHLPIHRDRRLMEINGGEWEGKAWKDLPSLFPEEAIQWNTCPWEFAPKGGESMRSVYDRMWRAMTDIVDRNREKIVCVTSHACAIRNFLCRAQGWPIERLEDVPWGDNTALSVVDFDSFGNSKVVLMNDASHLSPETSGFQRQKWWKASENRPAEGKT